MREKGALYYFGIPANEFDANYEKISPIIEGCVLRSNMGAASDIDFEELLKRFEHFNNNDINDNSNNIINSNGNNTSSKIRNK